MSGPKEDQLADEIRAMNSATAGLMRLQQENTRELRENTKANREMQLILLGNSTKEHPGIVTELRMLEPRVRALEDFKKLVIAHLLGAWTVLLGACAAGIGWIIKRSIE